MSRKLASPSESAAQPDWNADDQSRLAAALSVTPAQRLAWLEGVPRQAYDSGVLEPRRFIGKEEWEAMSSSLR